jgi:hypothetical protein
MRWTSPVSGTAVPYDGEAPFIPEIVRCLRHLEGHGTPELTKRTAVSLYDYGPSFAVAHLLGTTAQSLLRLDVLLYRSLLRQATAGRCGGDRAR